MKYFRFLAMLLIAATMAFTACGDDGNSGGGGDTDAIVSIAAIPGVTPPNYGETPVTTITETAQYTGTVSWSPSVATFAATTVYTATITLTAKSGYTLTGVASNFFTVAAGTSTAATNSADSGVVTAIFPVTGSAPATVINISAIPGVTVPAYGGTPVTTIIETDQYTGTVSWSPSDATFAATTVYTATITLTAKAGYTLTGVAANYFAVAGATATNAAGSGVVNAVFPATGAVPDIDMVFQSAVQIGGTSGTVTSTGLTLTFDVDPETLTIDNITVTGATKGSLSGTGTTRSLAITSITVANGATVSVTITSPTGYSITGTPQTAVVYRDLIGMSYQGGVIAYIFQSGEPGYVSGQTHGLIAATADQNLGIVWISGGSTQSTYVPTDTALGTGSANTDNIIAQAVAAGNSTPTSYAAGLARAHNGGGYNDWYLPSRDELNKLYANKAAIGGFTYDLSMHYWSSSNYNSIFAWYQNFSDGSQTYYNKSNFIRVRAVRAF